MEADIALPEDEVVEALAKVGNRTKSDVIQKGSTAGQALEAVNVHLAKYGYKMTYTNAKTLEEFKDLLYRRGVILRWDKVASGHVVSFDSLKSVIYDGATRDLTISYSKEEAYSLMGDRTGTRSKFVFSLEKK